MPGEFLHFLSDPTSAALTTAGFAGGLALAYWLSPELKSLMVM
jgi:hypothetical protein